MGRKKDLTLHETRKCLMCDNTFEVYTKSKKKYCSIKCMNQDPELIAKKKKTAKNTIDTKYNGVHWMNNKDTQKRHKETMNKRYGVDHALQNKEVHEKFKSTMIERYDVPYASQNYEIFEKNKNTRIERYGGLHNNNHLSKRLIKYQIIKTWKHISPLFTEDELISGGVVTARYNFKCNECGYEFDACLNSGYIPRCKACAMKKISPQSRGELEVIEFIKSLDENIVMETKNRSILKGHELDIYLPEFKLAIEYNGLFWHSELGGGKNKNYHLLKTKLC